LFDYFLLEGESVFVIFFFQILHKLIIGVSKLISFHSLGEGCHLDLGITKSCKISHSIFISLLWRKRRRQKRSFCQRLHLS
jgi:hypothetical protein